MTYDTLTAMKHFIHVLRSGHDDLIGVVLTAVHETYERTLKRRKHEPIINHGKVIHFPKSQKVRRKA